MSARDRLLQSLDMKKLACMKLAKENPNQTFFEVDFSPCEHFRWHKLTSYSMLRSFVAIAIDGASLLPCAALTVPLAQLRSSAADGARGQRGNRGALRTVSRVAVPRATRHRGPNQVVAPTLFSASTRQSHIFARIHCEGSDSQGSCAWATSRRSNFSVIVQRGVAPALNAVRAQVEEIGTDIDYTGSVCVWPAEVCLWVFDAKFCLPSASADFRKPWLTS